MALTGLAGPAAAAQRDVGYDVPEAPPYCTGHFCVPYVRQGGDAPSLEDTGGVPGVPDYVETVARAGELARRVENLRLGWRAPVGDGKLGGGRNLTDIYIVDLSGFASGTTSTDAKQKAGSGRHTSSSTTASTSPATTPPRSGP